LTLEKILYNDLGEAAQKKRVEELKTFSYKCLYGKLANVRWGIFRTRILIAYRIKLFQSLPRKRWWRG